jgi:hypothetical protein
MASNKKLRGRSLKTAMTVAGFALAAGLGLTVQAFAQQHDEGQQHGPHGGPNAWRGAHGAEMCELMDARQAGMLAFTEVRLGITDAERPAWTKFEAAVKASSVPMKQLCASAGQAEPKTLPEHLHRLEAMETAHLEQLRQVTPAVEELYGTLAPKQKEIADHLIEGMIHHGPGPGGPGEPGMHHGDMPGHDAPAKAPN